MRAELEQTADRIAGREPTLLVDAPAGFGKTFQAAVAAERLVDGLAPHQSILLLSHTNAAADEFKRRSPTSRVRVQTFDSLACGLVERYARYLNVPVPLRPDALHLGHPSFADIRRMAADLLTDAPAIAHAMACRYPVILGDEYQDSTHDHHRLLTALAEAPNTRVRLFADGMQAIFGFDGALISWDELISLHPSTALTHGYRWDGSPEFRDWLANARSSLMSGQPISTDVLPNEVQVRYWQGEAPGPQQRGNCPNCYQLLRRLDLSGEVAYLLRNRRHSRDLAIRVPGLAKLHEAGESEEAAERLERARASINQPGELALLLVETLKDWGSGISAQAVRQISEVCGSQEISLGRKRNIEALALVCEPIYEQPDERGFIRAFAKAVESRTEIGWLPVRRDLIWLLASLSPDAEDLGLALQALAQMRRGRGGPQAKWMTIHKAKGREFDTVVLPFAAASCFPDSEEAAKLLYVALTRATKRLRVLIPTGNPSPWFQR